MEQISVFLENDTGRLAEVTHILSDAGVNLRAISIADTADFGILRLIVNNNASAIQALNSAGFTTQETEVAALEIDDKPGALAQVITDFQAAKINIEYLYASLEGKKGKAAVIFKLSDHNNSVKLIKNNNLSVIEEL